MEYIASQYQRTATGDVLTGQNVIFDKRILETSPFELSYNPTTGVFTIIKQGLYYINWWVSTQTTLSNETSFSIKTSSGKFIKGNTPNLHDQVLGNTILEVLEIDTPYTFSLVNSSSQTIYYSQNTNISADIVITEIGELLRNLVDGNAIGAVRGINTSIGYTMGINSMAIGTGTVASGNYSFSQGEGSIASNTESHAEGSKTVASGPVSHAEGIDTLASGVASHAEGVNTQALGSESHAEGLNTVASGSASHAEGRNALAIGIYSHAEGDFTTASGNTSHAEGSRTYAVAIASHAEGSLTKANGGYSHAEGDSTETRGLYSHAEGRFTKSIGDYSHAEGEGTTASGNYSHSAGSRTIASGGYSHTEGEGTTASGDYSHAEGRFTVASGDYSHSQGLDTTASGEASTTFGERNTADVRNSFAGGLGNSTNNIEGAFIIGKYGEAKGMTATTGPAGTTGFNNGEYGFFIGNGVDSSNKGLAAAILSSGALFIDGGVNTPASDYAEMYEVSNEFIDVGHFVTFDKGDKIRKANKEDNYILGVTSAVPGIIGNSAALRWKDKYITDEWGRVQYEVIIEYGKLKQIPKINPSWDSSKEYIARANREEWVCVGLLGQLRVRDNGDCQVDGYCKWYDEGIAIPSEDGYRVIKRVNENQIIIQFK